jgi:hypothetical protein
MYSELFLSWRIHFTRTKNTFPQGGPANFLVPPSRKIWGAGPKPYVCTILKRVSSRANSYKGMLAYFGPRKHRYDGSCGDLVTG